jgi:hypothetical protein
MLARSGGWPGTGTVEDKGGNNGAAAGVSTLLPRSNKAINATAMANVAMPMAIHGMIVRAFEGAGATAAVSDVPHSWHARDPGLTVIPQDGQADTMDTPQ